MTTNKLIALFTMILFLNNCLSLPRNEQTQLYQPPASFSRPYHQYPHREIGANIWRIGLLTLLAGGTDIYLAGKSPQYFYKTISYLLRPLSFVTGLIKIYNAGSLLYCDTFFDSHHCFSELKNKLLHFEPTISDQP